MIGYLQGAASTFILFFAASLYFGIIICDIFNVSAPVAFVFPFLTVLIQYLFFPRLLDKIFSGIKSDDENEKLNLFKKSINRKNNNIDIWLWDISYPILFHYGIIGTKTKCVISKGLLEALTDDEIIALSAFEKNKIAAQCRHLFMMNGFLPFCLFHISRFLYNLGLRHKAVGGAGSIVSFSGALAKICYISYMCLYLTSRSLNLYAARPDGSSPRTEDTAEIKIISAIIEKIEKKREMEISQKLTELIFSLNFLDISDPLIPFRKHRNYTLTNYWQSDWKEYVDFFHSHYPRQTLSETGKKSPEKKQKDQNYIWFMSAILLSIAFLATIMLNLSPALPMLLLGLTLLKIHITQRPWKKMGEVALEQLIEESPVSCIKGYPLQFKGGIVNYKTQEMEEKSIAVKSGKYTLPLYFFSLSKPQIPLPEDGTEIQVAGWLKKGEEISFEAAAIRQGEKTIYTSNPLLTHITADLIIISLSIMIIILNLKGG